MQKYTHIKGLKKAVQFFGSQSNWARALNIPRSSVNHWMCGNKDIPLKHALKTEVITGKRIKAKELRDFF